jgi:TolA-binding protein
MKTPVFVSFCALMTVLIVALHGLMNDNHAPLEKLKAQMALVEKERSRAELRAQLLRHEIADFQNRVATLLPEAVHEVSDPANYPLRQLASVIADPGDSILIERGSGLFEKAKTAFREKDFEGANQLLKSLLARYPESVHVPSAYFLLTEGHYQLKEYTDSIGNVERLIESYPENELTGFALLRLGHIFEAQERLEDAGDVYKSVLSNFTQTELLKQAQASLKAVTL